jgi:fructosamine-3-kinase
MPLWTDIANHITAATGKPFHCQQSRSMGGGCINESYVIAGDEQRYFVKLNTAHLSEMFEAEAAGLNEIATSHTMRVPQVICYGISDQQSYLVLEHVEFGRGDSHSHAQLGRDLARMHRHTAKQFGWYRNNTLGATPQPNRQSDDWCEFWRTQRLGHQLQLAAENGYSGQLQSLGQQLLDELDRFFINHQPQPSLLHGDLWSGNYAIAADGAPLIFDPAVYYGDRETDIAMTELFGGFPAEFYRAYEAEYPLAPGYAQRKQLYNLYHILNHLNLFGGGYLRQSVTMMEQLLRG